MLDAIILCGGRGSRLSSVVSDVPKPLAPVLGRPFLDHLLSFIAQSGAVEGAVLAIHHLSDRIVSYYETHPAPLPLQFVREPKPLGTGGALFHSMAAAQGRTLFCFNGDSLCGGDLTALVEAHRSFGPGFTLGLTHVSDTSRYGSVDMRAIGAGSEIFRKVGLAWTGAHQRRCLCDRPRGVGTVER